MQKRVFELLSTQMRIRNCLDDIKEQLGSKYYKKIEEEFQVQIRGWMPKYKGPVTFIEFLSYVNDNNDSLEIKEQCYQGLDTYLKKKSKAEVQELIE